MGAPVGGLVAKLGIWARCGVTRRWWRACRGGRTLRRGSGSGPRWPPRYRPAP